MLYNGKSNKSQGKEGLVYLELSEHSEIFYALKRT